jgi:hypothetical protein
MQEVMGLLEVFGMPAAALLSCWSGIPEARRRWF